jgi:hypothetical protein
VLDNHRLAAGEITQAAIADPGVLELHARGLRPAELATRALDVRSVLLRAAGDVPRVANLPPLALEGPSVGLVRLGEEERYLERLVGAVR